MEYLNEPLEDIWAVDIEGDGLYNSVTRVHILCAVNVGTGETFESENYKDTAEFLGRCRIVVGHNILAYDAPVLNRLVGTKLYLRSCIDTLVMSWLYSPKLPGGHSLEEYGVRFGIPKVGTGITNWSVLTDEMRARCRGDAELTKRVYLALRKKMLGLGFSNQSIYIQHAIRVIMEKQNRTGIAFNEPEAIKLYTHLRQRCKEIEERIHELFPPVLKEIKRGKYSLKKDGTPCLHYMKAVATYPRVDIEDTEYVIFDYVPFNLGSPQQRVEKLLSVGWEPTEWTPKGSPKITEEQLLDLVEKQNKPEIVELIKWMSFNGRANMINNWLDNLGPDGRIHGNMWVAGTLRFRHDNPNKANIPRVRKDKKTGKPLLGEEGMFTYEARNLWMVSNPRTRVLVGIDAKGLEFRMLAHEINDPEFTKQVCEGDIHSFMQGVYELNDRDQSKTTSYAIIYGGQDAKIGSIVGGRSKEGARVRANAYRNLPGLEQATKRATTEFNQGRIKLCDGSLTICPSRHSALNYKLQGGGARVMALGAILLDEKVRHHRLDAYKVLDVHDEWQWDCAIEDAETLEALALDSLREAGEQLNLNVPIEGSTAKGLTWASTH